MNESLKKIATWNKHDTRNLNKCIYFVSLFPILVMILSKVTKCPTSFNMFHYLYVRRMYVYVNEHMHICMCAVMCGMYGCVCLSTKS
jgi:hypothetical protein